MRHIKYGCRGDEVRYVQVLVNGLTGVSPALVEDGVFGPKTYQGVLLFQGQHQLAPDGIVGPNTARTFLSALSPRR